MPRGPPAKCSPACHWPVWQPLRELLGQGGRFQAGILFLCSQSTVCEKIMELLGQNEVDHRQRKLVILSQDRFYKVLTPEQKAKALKGQYNFDHPGRERPQG